MEHFYESIEGYFTFPDYYTWLAKQAARISSAHPPHGVEVGVFTGQSAAYLGVELINAGATPCRLDLVDLWHHTSFEQVQRALKPPSNVIGDFIRECSWDAARHYKDRSLDWVFIDADHTYESVCKDIEAWLPKVRKGGIIAGHDYCEWPTFGVIKAVDEHFPKVEIWQGKNGMGDAQMRPHYWPVWSTIID